MNNDKLPDGVTLIRNYVPVPAYNGVLNCTDSVISECPLFTPTMRNGTPFNYQMTNCGDWGWISDSQGYRYTQRNPLTNRVWPHMPELLKQIAQSAAVNVGVENFEPDTCLINYYRLPKSRLGKHCDNTEKDLESPIISLSIGDSGLFSVGGLKRDDPMTDVVLNSGDLIILHGPGRMLFHEFKGLVLGPQTPYRGGRFNLTFRRTGLEAE